MARVNLYRKTAGGIAHRYFTIQIGLVMTPPVFRHYFPDPGSLSCGIGDLATKTQSVRILGNGQRGGDSLNSCIC